MKELNIDALTRVVVWLDGYVALSSVDPSKIERNVKKNSEHPDVVASWTEVKSDVQDIARLPSKSSEILRLSKRMRILRPLLLYMGLLIFTVFIILSNILSATSPGHTFYVIFIAAFVIAYFSGFAVYVVFDRKLRRLATEYCETHAGEVSRQRKHIKQVNQRLIDKLASSIRSKKLDPEKYKFILLHNDYSNIIVLREGKNSLYSVMVKGRKSED